MRLFTMTMILLMSSLSQAETLDFNEAIKEATVSQNLLHRRLLRILQRTEVSIADKNLFSEIRV